MDKNQNQIVISDINLCLQRFMNGYVNKIVFGINQKQHTTEAELLYLYRRVLETRTFSSDYLSDDEYNAIYIDAQNIIKKLL